MKEYTKINRREFITTAAATAMAARIIDEAQTTKKIKTFPEVLSMTTLLFCFRFLAPIGRFV